MGRFDFVSPGAMAGSAIQEELVRRQMMERQAMLDEQRRQEAEADRAARQQQLMLNAEEQNLRRQQMTRQATLDAQTASKTANERGVRQMIADAISQAPGGEIDPQLGRQISGMAYREGVAVPGIVEQAVSPDEYTLNPGDIRFRGTKQIAQGGPKTAAPPTLGSFEDYVARTYGANPAPEQIMKARTEWERANDRPTAGPQPGFQWVLRGADEIYTNQILPGDRPLSRQSGSRGVISGDAGRIADFDTSLDEVQNLKTGIGDTGFLPSVGAAMPKAITDITGIGTEAKKRQATVNRVKQIIGKTLEGGVLREADEIKYKEILPTMADTEDVVKAKIAGLEQTLTQRRARLLESLEDAGYDTSRYPKEWTPSTPPPTGRRKRYDINGNEIP